MVHAVGSILNSWINTVAISLIQTSNACSMLEASAGLVSQSCSINPRQTQTDPKFCVSLAVFRAAMLRYAYVTWSWRWSLHGRCWVLLIFQPLQCYERVAAFKCCYNCVSLQLLSLTLSCSCLSQVVEKVLLHFRKGSAHWSSACFVYSSPCNLCELKSSSEHWYQPTN